MMNKKVVSTVLTAIVVISTFSAICTPASAATEDEIEQAIAKGTAWLAAQQNPDGSWGAWYCDVNTSYTGLALIKLQDRAYELGYASPFDPDYEYSENVIKGWKFIFSTNASGTPLYVMNQTPLSKQTHGGNIDDPDTNGNGYGVYFAGCYGAVPVYTTGIILQALKASGTPNRPNDGGIDFNGDGNADTFQEMAQDAVEWMAFAQGDSGNDEGGWGYTPLDNQGDDPNNPNTPPGTFWTDNSNGGYAVLGLAAGEGFGCTVPAWVRTELNIWIGTIQDPVNGDVDDGGSYYNPDYLLPPMNLSMCNELKAGNLIFQMTFYGDDPTVQRFKDAMDYIERHWNDQNFDPGWKGDYGVDDDGDTLIDEDPWDGSDNDGDTLIDEDPGISNYQAIYCLMKGFEYSGIELIDLDGDNVPEHDWYEEFTTALVEQQYPAGYWSMRGYYGSEEIDTAWALLTLEKITPPPPMTPGKITGGGFIAAPVQTGGKKVDTASFGFVVIYDEGYPAPKGELAYTDLATGMNVHAPDMTKLVVSDDKTQAWFEGTCTIDGEDGHTFEAYVEDNNEPGVLDVFEITLDTGYAAGGSLLGGNVQIHKKP